MWYGFILCKLKRKTHYWLKQGRGFSHTSTRYVYTLHYASYHQITLQKKHRRKVETSGEKGKMLEAKSLRKAVVAPSLLENPSAANLQSTRLALHVLPYFPNPNSLHLVHSLLISVFFLFFLFIAQVDGGGSSCRVYIASGCSIYSVQVLERYNRVGWFNSMIEWI